MLVLQQNPIEEAPEAIFSIPDLECLTENTSFNEEVRLFLQFEDTYLSGRRALSPEVALEVHARNYFGEEKRALGREYGIDEDIIGLMVKRVNKAAKIVAGDYTEEEFIPRYRHFLNVYHAFTAIPDFLDKSISGQTELGILLEQNPHVQEIFRHAATGKPLREYFNAYGLGGIEGINEDPYVKCFQKLFVKREWDHITLTSISQAVLFSKYLRGEHETGNRMQVAIGRLLNNKETFSVEDKRYSFIRGAKRFLELGFLIDYHQSKERENYRRLKTFMSDPTNPRSVDLDTYYRDGFANYGIPYGLKTLIRANINFEQASLKKLISKEFFYAYGTLKTPLLHGYRFLENELLIGSPLHSIHPTIADYCRNRRTDNERIMQLIADEFGK